jgi:hypothetical protein
MPSPIGSGGQPLLETACLAFETVGLNDGGQRMSDRRSPSARQGVESGQRELGLPSR